MTEISKQLAESLFREINENIGLAEECWRKDDVRFETYFRQAKERLREFESLFEE